MEIKEQLSIIANSLYSTLETQHSSFNSGIYIELQDLEGDIVECGIAAGANLATMILGSLHADPKNKKRRYYWGFDSFEGIQLAGKRDTLQAGIGAITHDVNVPEEELLKSSGITIHSKQSVLDNFSNWNIPDFSTLLIEGWVQNTLLQSSLYKNKRPIAILRLDMDIYDPTKFVLEHIYDQVVAGGIVILDDWGLDGSRNAMLEFLEERNIQVKWIDIPNSEPKYFYKP